MPELNLAKINAKLADIRTSLGILRRYAERPDAEFLGNAEAVGAAKYAFIVMIEAAVAIATHLCARLLSRAPSSQRESFEILGQAGVLPSGLAEDLARMAGFRNVLVHGYAGVDDVALLAFMRERLGDFDRFVTAVARLAESAPGREGETI